MHEFDACCLPPVNDYAPEAIKTLRLRCRARPSTVQKWAQGQQHPNGPSPTLLTPLAQSRVPVLTCMTRAREMFGR